MSSRRQQSPSRPAPGAASGTGAPPDPADSRSARPLPGAPQRRLEGTTALALLAVAIAAIALVVGVLNALGPGRANCQSDAWDSVPGAASLPAGWSLGSTDYYVASQTTTLLGPMTDDATGGAVVYASVTCFGDSAGEALDRSRTSAEDAGATVEELAGIGDEGYAMSDASSGSSAYHFRRGGLVAYVAVSGTVSPSELDQVAVAVDAAMTASQGGPAPTGVVRPSEVPATGETPGPSAGSSPSPSPSPRPEESLEPEASPVAAALEARLPSQVGGINLVRDSATADAVLGDDTSSRALAAALRSLGRASSDLLLAQAYDETGGLSGSILGFELPGVEGAELKTIILDSWLLADSPGVTTSEVTLSGRPFTKVSYGDGGSSSYVTVVDGAVLIIDAAEDAQASEFAASLP